MLCALDLGPSPTRNTSRNFRPRVHTRCRARLDLTPRPRTSLRCAEKFLRASEECSRLERARSALGLPATATEVLEAPMEELSELKKLWAELSTVWANLHKLKDLPWASVCSLVCASTPSKFVCSRAQEQMAQGNIPHAHTLQVAPRKLRQSLEGLVDQMKAMPNWTRHYAAYDHLQARIKGYLKANALVVELRSEALRERHWRTLISKLRVNWTMSDLRLGEVWDADLDANENIIRDVVTVAQGEMALEEFLKQVKETWQTYEIDFVNFQVCTLWRSSVPGSRFPRIFGLGLCSNTCTLDHCTHTAEQDASDPRVGRSVWQAAGAPQRAAGHDPLPLLQGAYIFASLLSLSLSPTLMAWKDGDDSWHPRIANARALLTAPTHPRVHTHTHAHAQVFAEEAGSWDDKINRLYTVFDIWIDVQRRWVYLEGIFTNSQNIRRLLPAETARFDRCRPSPCFLPRSMCARLLTGLLTSSFPLFAASTRSSLR